MNPMREIRIEKVVVNIGVGNDQNKLERAKKLLESLSGKKCLVTKTTSRTTFGMPKGKPIGVKITLRKKDAIEILKRFLETKDNRLSPRCFDNDGNFSFGIHEHIDIPGVKYDPKIGIMGMDVCVSLERPGYRIKRKKLSKKIGKKHRIIKDEAIEFMKKNFGVEVV
ncbi:MAG: 50S ribosomal protein L5 [Candidatus Aenigmarchaeota archaeon]|nr:50S ribosomal protein L5 [Candidatus Aenigmarchaeota archaeon]